MTVLAIILAAAALAASAWSLAWCIRADRWLRQLHEQAKPSSERRGSRRG